MKDYILICLISILISLIFIFLESFVFNKGYISDKSFGVVLFDLVLGLILLGFSFFQKQYPYIYGALVLLSFFYIDVYIYKNI